MKTRPSNQPFDRHSPDLQFEVPFMGDMRRPAMEMSVGTLIQGSSGSGKTVSGVLPMLRSLITYRNEDDKPCGIVYIDWKCESLDNVQNYLSERGELGRLVYTLEVRKPFYLFEFQDRSNAEGVVATWVAVTGHKQGHGDAQVWSEKGLALLKKILHAEILMRPPMSDCLQRLKSLKKSGSDVSATGVLLTLVSLYPDLVGQFKGARFEDLADVVLSSESTCELIAEQDQSFFYSATALMELLANSNVENKMIMRQLRILYSMLLKKQSRLVFPVPPEIDKDAATQYNYYFDVLKPMLQKLTDPELNQFVNVDPLLENWEKKCTSFRSMLDKGKVILHQPLLSSPYGNEAVCSTLRSLMCQYIKSKKDPRQVTGYVCDEFHNYLSLDPADGDVSLVSWGRAFRCFSVFCSQSTYALFNRARELKGQEGDMAVKALLTNLPNKLVFRSNETDTQVWAEQAVGKKGGILGLSTLHTRPLSSLSPGEYHYITSNGRKGLQSALSLEIVEALEAGNLLKAGTDDGHPQAT